MTRQQLGPEIVFVDLDGTLVRADLFAERLVRLLVNRPWLLIAFILQFKWSIAALKGFVARNTEFDARFLPYNEDVILRLRSFRSKGASIVLATAAHEIHASAVAAHLGLFERVLASNDKINLKSRSKLGAIKEVAGAKEFCYLGDAHCDLAIFNNCSAPILVGGSRRLKSRFLSSCKNGEALEIIPRIWMKSALKALRPHQWAKNVLLFLPAITSFGLYAPERLVDLVAAFLLFCICASLVYLVNDLGDIDADRAHPDKCRRPFASGALSSFDGLLLMAGLLAIGGTLGVAFLWDYLCFFVLYLAVSWGYSAFLKEVAVLDVFVLAFLYVVRVVVGAEVLQVFYTSWFIIFLSLSFLSLGWLKRYVEMGSFKGDLKERRRGYVREDAQLASIAGISCAFCGMLVLFLYTTTDDVRTIYASPDVLLLLGIPYLYLMLDLWRLAGQGKLHHDPVRHVLTAPKAYAAVFFAFTVLIIARNV